ncbi:MAG: type II secretion system GspH family protein [Candidatus Pacebacteria bacterium]|nr:type II secretion system GspH family protein [Candidatus Paceibacterota bacterium]
MRYNTRAQGFTLVEMLVVLAIVIVLLAIVLPSFGDARQNARDKKRIADLAQIQLALEVYFDIHGHYPRESDGYSGYVGENNNDITTLLSSFITEVPRDPITTTTDYIYYYDGSQVCGGHDTQAILVAHMENDALGNNTELICSSWGGAGGTEDTNAYIVILGKSSG